MWQYTWPDSFLLSPLAGFLRVHLDCGIPWPCFPGLNYWQFSCSCGYRQSRAWTFLTSRGQAHPQSLKCLHRDRRQIHTFQVHLNSLRGRLRLRMAWEFVLLMTRRNSAAQWKHTNNTRRVGSLLLRTSLALCRANTAEPLPTARRDRAGLSSQSAYRVV